MWRKEFIEILGVITFSSGIIVIGSIPLSIGATTTLRIWDKAYETILNKK